MKNVIVLARAAADLQLAKEFYDEQEPGLGEYCITSVLASLERLAEFRGIHSRHFGYHRMIATPFPIGIYYREHRDDALVIAILDLRRDPKWIRKQLHQRPNI
ncbi:MAG: type II toxin-antitoxin system RelE/ParE family toxin [Verrucomicrobiota bacterium]|nr:type II toxin-antitoxin system RelE/ParE family toxin [Verrucomicrobiota bacterium]